MLKLVATIHLSFLSLTEGRGFVLPTEKSKFTWGSPGCWVVVVPFLRLQLCRLQTGSNVSSRATWHGRMVCVAFNVVRAASATLLPTDLPFPSGGILPGYYPVVGNGYLALEVGPFVVPWVNSWPWKDAGSIHVAGVNNGQSFAGPMGPSHRAQIPNPLNPILLKEDSGSYTNVGSAIDYGETIATAPQPCERFLACLSRQRRVHESDYSKCSFKM